MATKKEYIYDGRKYSPEEISQLLQRAKAHLPSRARKSIEMVEGDMVLDVGCGLGFFPSLIAPKVSKVVAIDILASSIEIARDFSSLPNIEFIAGDLFQLNFPDNSFDCVLFLETIEHVESPTKFLNEFHRILKPNGCLVVSTPNALSYQNIAFQFYHFMPKVAKFLVQAVNKEQRNIGTQVDHIYLWDFETFYRLLNRSGFTYVDHAFAGFWPLELPIPPKFYLRFPFWTKWETKVMSLLKPFCLNLVFKVRKS